MDRLLETTPRPDPRATDPWPEVPFEEALERLPPLFAIEARLARDLLRMQVRCAARPATEEHAESIWVDVWSEPRVVRRPGIASLEGRRVPVMTEQERGARWVPIPHIARDLAQAWLCVEHDRWPLTWVVGRCQDGYAIIDVQPSTHPRTVASASTAPLAICRAALLLLGRTEETR